MTFFFLFGFYGPFKNISLISSRSFIKGGRKPENLEKKHLTIRKMGVNDEVRINSNTTSGPSCSKLTMSLLNDLLKFTSSDTQICCNFLLKKCELLLHCKSYSHFLSKKYQNIVY